MRELIWQRWRSRSEPAQQPSPPAPFEDVLEDAPVPALLLDGVNAVVAANAAGAAFFGINREALPKGLVEATREGALLDVLRAGRHESELGLVHSGRTVRTRLVPGPRAGDTLLFVTDLTDLRRLERVRQEFVANLSHELKTPVTSLRLAVESLEGDPAAEDRRRFIRHALDEADHLAAVIENLRRLASLEAGEVPVARTMFPLAAAVRDVVDRLQLAGRVRVDVDPDLHIRTDREMLSQALANLLENAARFSPADAEVTVSAAPGDAETTISVSDRGPGIAPEHWERVFERFYKVDPARTRPRGEPAGRSGFAGGPAGGAPTPPAGGTGLGLAITKHLVQALGGRVWTEAGAESGQVFTIALPAPGLAEDGLPS